MRRIMMMIGTLVVAAVAAFVFMAATGSDPGAVPAQAQPEEDFVPSEELPSDSAISFPVDI
jgi:hypothetical protein